MALLQPGPHKAWRSCLHPKGGGASEVLGRRSIRNSSPVLVTSKRSPDFLFYKRSKTKKGCKQLLQAAQLRTSRTVGRRMYTKDECERGTLQCAWRAAEPCCRGLCAQDRLIRFYRLGAKEGWFGRLLACPSLSYPVRRGAPGGTLGIVHLGAAHQKAR